MYRITELARMFGLSRSTLLYYDRIGLLKPSERSETGYRLYSQTDKNRLASVCSLRKAGLSIEDIGLIQSMNEDTNVTVLKRRMDELAKEIRTLQNQQHLLGQMLKIESTGRLPSRIDKRAWVEMLRAAGMDEAAMQKWHCEFERRAPEDHHRFLLDLGIPEEEAICIRQWSALKTGHKAQNQKITPDDSYSSLE